MKGGMKGFWGIGVSSNGDRGLRKRELRVLTIIIKSFK